MNTGPKINHAGNRVMLPPKLLTCIWIQHSWNSFLPAKGKMGHRCEPQLRSVYLAMPVTPNPLYPISIHSAVDACTVKLPDGRRTVTPTIAQFWASGSRIVNPFFIFLKAGWLYLAVRALLGLWGADWSPLHGGPDLHNRSTCLLRSALLHVLPLSCLSLPLLNTPPGPVT